MLGQPADRVWRTGLTCGCVLILASRDAPTGIITCPTHKNLVSIISTERWDYQLARLAAERRHETAPATPPGETKGSDNGTAH